MSITPAGLSEFHQPYFVLLNLAVGGNWPGYPDETTVFPQTLEVDFVRVYSCGSVSTENFHSNENVTIYPVPSDDFVNINSTSNMLSYSLSDLNGRNIFKSDYINQNSIKLNIDKQPPGIYLLQVNTSDGSSHFKKLIKSDNQN
jgi:beta-glucanase (GH16 family)